MNEPAQERPSIPAAEQETTHPVSPQPDTVPAIPEKQPTPQKPQPAGSGKKVRIALISGLIAGILNALVTLLITLTNASTFLIARQQIAADRLTVKIALALVGWQAGILLASLLLGLATGWITGKITRLRWLGFLGGALAGAIYSLAIFLASSFPSYPGNLSVVSEPFSIARLLISALLLGLWALGGGLVGLFGAWVATVSLSTRKQP
ncbi:hypothetical protein EI42_02695 [Thermosporothrix hazakensis]|jgi:MFS family permease|uniref:Uncharacterized protein n=2 Tax=Thermosporothrix TaxID=768650 RepID=A0A326U621_THEHA|nr:YrzE family protein [Thermosporothrix hazakensis]PZW29401.1 hypothetical protein EI42_02695 [Thermosporothrix hazakensis]BBH85688.1 hypothetical protein KTC_04390 [Thermosporothrix sp. COM3]GCE45883.1 hypothetical protein KTH_07520 [Thermosporothrix hazakensis]